MVSTEERLAFMSARASVMGTDISDGGIGTLAEKSLHKILKLYIEPDPAHHEVKLLGSVADIFNENGVSEVQTRSLERLIPKLSKFLPEHRTTVVIPLAREKTVRWLDPMTGEISEPHKSPKHETVYTAMPELYKLRRFIGHENLALRFITMRAEDYRYLDGWDKSGKRGSTRMERIPLELLDDVTFASPAELSSLIPSELPEEFTARELSRAAKFAPRIESYVTAVLRAADVIVHVGKRGNAYIYKRKQTDIQKTSR